MKNRFLVILILLGIQQMNAQFTRRDSLQGGLRAERTAYDVKRYDLNITINPEQRSIKGFNEISFEILSPIQKIQLDLFENMKVDSIIWNSKKLKFTRDNDAVFVDFPEKLSEEQITKLSEAL